MRSIKLKTILVAVVLLFTFVQFGTFRRNGAVIIKVLDVGEGDATLITTQKGGKILIDGGPSSDILQKIPLDLPFFTCHINVVVSTHPHADHVTGLNSVLERCKVDLVIFNDTKYKSKAYERFLALVDAKRRYGLKVLKVCAGDNFTLGAATFNIIWPKCDLLSSSDQGDINKLSIVILMSYKGFRALFPDDAEASVFLSQIDSTVDILRVPHHGSYDSALDSLLDKIEPAALLISVGKNNRYNHPSKQVLGVAKRRNLKVYRTDKDGTITILVGEDGGYRISR